MEDKVQNTNEIYGFLKIEVLDKNGSVIDEFFEKNLIADTARKNMCQLMAGVPNGAPINKFVLGTMGHKDGNILTPKTTLEGYNSGRTQLFAEELSAAKYEIVFSGTSSSGLKNIISETNSAYGTSTIEMTQTDYDIVYVVNLPLEVGNGTGVVAYTEAGFYAGDDLFNIKTFPAKVKTSVVSLRITWKISF